jgi:hypothetical protein
MVMAPERFDPEKDATNRGKHGLSLGFGDRIFEDDNHMFLSSIRWGRAFQGDRNGRRKTVHRRSRLAGRDAAFYLGEKEQQE